MILKPGVLKKTWLLLSSIDNLKGFAEAIEWYF